MMQMEWEDLVPLVCDGCGATVVWYPGLPSNGTELKVTPLIYADIQRAQDAHVCGGVAED